MRIQILKEHPSNFKYWEMSGPNPIPIIPICLAPIGAIFTVYAEGITPSQRWIPPATPTDTVYDDGSIFLAPREGRNSQSLAFDASEYKVI